MAKRVCAEPDCPALTDQTRCPAHTRARDRARGTRQQRGYDASHDAIRRMLVRKLSAGQDLTCWRCGQPIRTEAELHVGHDDHDRSITRGAEHAACNLAAAGRSSHL